MHCPRCFRRYRDGISRCAADNEALEKSPDLSRVKAAPTRRAGDVVGGRYRIRGLIGHGGMARVFLAEDEQQGGPVAVKIMEPQLLKDARTRARFILEAKAAAAINHPNVVEMLDVGLQPDGSPYLVMEFLYGESLGQLLRRERHLSLEDGISVLAYVGEGIDAAHRAGVIHRDLKPDNIILLGEIGSPRAVKVLDFGLAKVREHGGMTASGTTVGTIEFMAPEQVVGDTTDARADIYGFGVLMYRTLVGKLPFKARERSETLALQLIKPLDHFDLGEDDLAIGIEAIILRSLRKRPDNRYASMDALMADIKKLQRGAHVDPYALFYEPDIYVPRNELSRGAARYFYEKIGVPMPSFKRMKAS